MERPNPAAIESPGDGLGGRSAGVSELLGLIYTDLRALAARHLRRERPTHTLQPTALVHEAWLRLVDCERMDWRGRTHFFAMAATMLRRVLIDHARLVRSEKRGGEMERVELSEMDAATEGDRIDFLALHEALETLGREDPRQARVVELRYFAGLGLEETARAMGVSVDTVKSEWRSARDRLHRELSRDRSEE
jgi:RNA polymerase sigma factor (TIGR02999 family)